MEFQFEWDPAKAAMNRAKHGVTFEEAQTVFFNPLAVIFEDEAHAGDEPREILIGHSARQRLLLVCFIERGRHIRLLSARRATRKERNEYEENRRV